VQMALRDSSRAEFKEASTYVKGTY
jgi:hypothetical protein